jgi:flagellar biosynthetic protein FliP
MKNVNWTRWLALLSLVLALAMAQDGMSALTVKTMADGSQEYSLTLQVLALMTALSFLPAMVIMMTSFTRSSWCSASCARPSVCSRALQPGADRHRPLHVVFHHVAGAGSHQQRGAAALSGRDHRGQGGAGEGELPIHQFMLAQTRSRISILSWR